MIRKRIKKGAVMCDIGCGKNASLVTGLAEDLKKGVGLDARTENETRGNIETMSADLENKLPLPSETFDLVTVLAVLEHIENDSKLLGECHRILKKDGKILITVPTKANRPVGEFISYKLKLINPDHYHDHKRYYDKKRLRGDLDRAGFKNSRLEYWEFGMNLFAEAYKK